MKVIKLKKNFGIYCFNISRENPTTGATKRAIPGEFWCADDPHAGGNVLSPTNLLCALGIKKYPDEFTLCAGEKWFTGIKNSKNPKKSKNSKKI
jgi:hypothetical protein